jgi:two-component system, OmpR family, sensor histidine kinase KdpD
MAAKQADGVGVNGRNHNPPPKRRGSLKVFLSYAPGAGKTLAMVKAGNQAFSAGKKVLAGSVQHQNRGEILSFLESIEYLTPAASLRGTDSQEIFDLDQALVIKPEIILLDDLAFVNPPGCRHKKRYQDVEELLRAGIDVYTTLNVQQLESLTDMVPFVDGYPETRRIPDNVLDNADFVELVDIEPKELLSRHPDGEYDEKILTHLREIALRITASQLNRIAARLRIQGNREESEVKDHILVCLSAAASNRKVIRTAARMAEVFHARFTALYVETSESNELAWKDKTELRDNLRLAEQLGAQIATVYGEDVPAQIAEYARTGHVSKIVLGRSPAKKRSLSKANVVDKLIALVPHVETYIIPYPEASVRKRLFLYLKTPRLSLADAGKTAAVLSVSTLIGFWFHQMGYREANIITVYIVGILLLATMTQGRIYSAAASVLSVLVFDFFFTDPRYSFRAYDSNYLVTFFLMLGASFLTSTLTMRVKLQARQAAQKAYRTEALLETSRKLQQAQDASAIMEETARQLVKLLDRTVIFYTAEDERLSQPRMFAGQEPPEGLSLFTDENERAVADWVFKNNKRAGAMTDTFSGARCLYLAVRGGETVFAVVAVVIDEAQPIEVFEKSLMIAMLGECGLALEKTRLNEQQQESSMQIQQEQLRANLLRSISHDLRTPLTSISGNAGILIGNSQVLNEEQKRSLYTDIYDDSIWLIHLVENLLSITRIENGTLNLNFQGELIEDVIAEALQHVSKKKEEHRIQVDLEDELLMARMDSRLIVQVLINLIDNAVKYTHDGSLIRISAKREEQMIRLQVADDGPGIPDGAKARLFDMFYTAEIKRGDSRRGLGLGLSLCKSIIHAHDGIIGVQDNWPKGTVFYFTLPAAEVSVYE